jgi:hypothetical protein
VVVLEQWEWIFLDDEWKAFLEISGLYRKTNSLKRKKQTMKRKAFEN